MKQKEKEREREADGSAGFSATRVQSRSALQLNKCCAHFLPSLFTIRPSPTCFCKSALSVARILPSSSTLSHRHVATRLLHCTFSPFFAQFSNSLQLFKVSGLADRHLLCLAWHSSTSNRSTPFVCLCFYLSLSLSPAICGLRGRAIARAP